TGFLPMAPAAVTALRAAGGDPQLLARAEARLAMTRRDAGRTRHDDHDRSRIRAILDEEIESVWGGRKPPKAALDAAVARAAPILAPAIK
ncbi:MAG: hypothetical protein KGZ43_03920, partial [Sulfuritalea sp.]|nr:hypothetical protein [Sulfuritalea sp.]